MSLTDYVLMGVAFYLWIGSLCAFGSFGEGLSGAYSKRLMKLFRLTDNSILDDLFCTPKMIAVFFVIVLTWPLHIWFEANKEHTATEIDPRVYKGIKNRQEAYRIMGKGELDEYNGNYVAFKDHAVIASNYSYGTLFRDMQQREDFLEIGIVYVRK